MISLAEPRRSQEPIPLLDLQAQYAPIQEQVNAAVQRVFAQKQFALGDAVQAFEKQFAVYCDCEEAIGVSSGTAALHLILRALEIGPGDEVIVPAMTFIATAAAVAYTGATPVFADVEPDRYTLDPECVAALITERTRAVMPVHLYGHPARMDQLLQMCEARGIALIEDAAQAHGAAFWSRRSGSMGVAAAFSFYPGKNLGAAGEAGAITTNDSALAEKMRVLRDWGQTERYRHEFLGYNYRMDGIQGAVLGVKLPHLEAWTEGRMAAAARYAEGLAGLEGIALPTTVDGYRHVYHVYATLIDERSRVREALQAAGVATGLHYPVPVHLQPCFAHLGGRVGQCPVAERVAQHELSLPLFAELTAEQQDRVVSVIRECLA